MIATQKSLFELTVADLQTKVVMTLPASMPLRNAAIELSQARFHGAPVVDEDGRCIGVLSVSDVARWAKHISGPTVGHARSCGYQDTHRGLGGKETVLCKLEEESVQSSPRSSFPTAKSYWSAESLTVFFSNGKWSIRSRSQARMSGTT